VESGVSLKGEQIIGSAFRSSTGQNFAAVNPASGAVLDPLFSEATSDDVDRASRAAADAFQTYRKISMGQRADFLECIGTQLTGMGADLIARAHDETALPLPRLEGELARTVGQIKLFAQQVRNGSFVEPRIDRASPSRLPVPKPELRTMQIPIGPVAVFGASNFPLAFSTAGGDTAAALAAGCPVVVKGHPAHPGTSELAGHAVMRAARDSGVPSGVFSLLQAKRTEAGAFLVQHPSIKAVAFTGSLTGGRALYDLACSRPEPIPVYAEMGSANPVFLLPQVVAVKGGLIADGLTESLTLGVGQFCTSPGLLFALNDGATNHFLDRLEAILAAKKPEVMLHEGIKANYLTGVNARSMIDGVETHLSLDDTLNGCLASPTLLCCNVRTLIDNPVLSDELFGPSVLVVLCQSKEEMQAAAVNLQGQLTASVHGTEEDFDAFRDLFDVLEQKAGRLVVNGFSTGVEVCASMHHGGPYPATTDSRATSVGTEAVKRFLRPVCYQDFPQELLPEELRDQNEQKLWRLVDGILSCEDL
jgi:NADP-dependent aldehyde dehydrogenase